MANPTCTVDGFQTTGACFQNMTPTQRLAAIIYFNSLELAANEGTSYTLGVNGTLLADAVSYNTMTEDQIQVANVVIAYNNAVSAGATPPDANTGIQDLQEQIKCVENFGPRMMQQMKLLLECQLGRHADYPQ